MTRAADAAPPAARSKLIDRAAAARWVRRAQRRGERVVFTSGCFDLLHVGHVRSLEQARRLGDRLIVALNRDAGVRRLKGPGRPIVPERQRAELLAALACVDRVMLFAEATPRAALAALRPDVYAKGGDWSLATLRAADVPPGLALEVRRLRQVPRVRSSALVARARESGGPARPARPRNREGRATRPTPSPRVRGAARSAWKPPKGS